MLRIAGGTGLRPGERRSTARSATSGSDDGKVVAARRPRRRPTRIDATGLVVMPGGVDMHCHIAGPKVNVARKMRPEEKRRRTSVAPNGDHALRAPSAACRAPSPPATCTPASATPRRSTPPSRRSRARHAHEEFARHAHHRQGLPRPGRQQPLRHASRSRPSEPADRLRGRSSPGCCTRPRATASKVVNPGGVETWKRGGRQRATPRRRRSRRSASRPRQILRETSPRAVDELGLPHPVHVHCNNLGLPGNWPTTLETMQALEGPARAPRRTSSSTATAATPGDRTPSARKAPELAEYVNAHPSLTVDVGQVLFGETTCDDRRRAARLLPAQGHRPQVDQRRHSRWRPAAASCRSRTRSKKLVHALQWAIGLEWYLLVEDPWRVAHEHRPPQRRLVPGVPADHRAC